MPTTSQYRVLHHFSRKLYEAFVRAEYSCRLLDGDERILIPMRSPPDFTISFNGEIQLDGRWFCDVIRVPHVACLVDPPFRVLGLTKSPYAIMTCDDRFGCEMLNKLKFFRTAFMPHAVEPDLFSNARSDRIYDIVLLASCTDLEQRRQEWRRLFPDNVWRAMEETTEAVLTKEESFIPLMQKRVSPRRFSKAFAEVEMYLKARERSDLLDAIQDREIHVFGNITWNKKFKSKTNLITHSSVPYEQAIEVMKQSKIVLNSSIKNYYGAHERIFTAAACGAVVVTNDNPFMRENFEDGKEILLYRRGDLAQLNKAVHQLLDNEDQRIQLAEAGQKRVMQSHTWDHRVKQLMTEIAPILEAYC